jgi:mRNA-decapping enzyme 1B
MTKINLNVNEQARKEANLRLLKRSVDRSIGDILGGATHVVLYHFHEESQKWEKSDVEGSLSLAVRGAEASASSSRHVLVILNRNSPENYPMDFTSDFQLQKSDPFLIFKNYEQRNHSGGGGDGDGRGPATIRGIWFPNDNERDSMNELLVGVLKSLKEGPPPPPAPSPAPMVDRNAATASLFAALNIGIDGGNSSSSRPQQQQQQHPVQTTTTQTPSPSHSHQQPILDKKSLQLALLSLIQDERFLDLLHAQYLKVHNARASRN